jgi:ABC-2 type transport system permease protein
VTAFLVDVATIARREWLRYRRERMFLLGQILLPALAVLLVGYGLAAPVGELGGGVDYPSFLASGLLVLVISSGAIGGGYTLIEDVQRGFLRPVLVAPVSRSAIVIGKILARLVLSLALALALVGVLAIVTGLRLPHPWIGLGALAAVTFGCVAAGILVAANLRRLESFRFIAVFVTVPLYFLSGMFFPVDTMPAAMRWAALANPLTYGVDLLRYATLGVHALPLAVDAAVVAALAVLPTALAIAVFSRGPRDEA